MIDSGASCCFISEALTQDNEKIRSRLESSFTPVELATGVRAEARHVAVGVSVRIGSYSDQLSFVEVPLKGCDAILGMTWLAKYNPATNWKNRTMSFYHDGKTHQLDTQSNPLTPSLPSLTIIHTTKTTI